MDHLKLMRELHDPDAGQSDTPIMPARRDWRHWLKRPPVWIAVGVLCLFAGGAMVLDHEATRQADLEVAKAMDAVSNGHNSEALAALDRAIALKQDPRFYYWKAIVLAEGAEKIYEAEINADKAVSLDPNNPAMLHYAGQMAYNTENLEKARDYFKKAAQLSPRNTEYQLHVAAIYHALSETDKAIAVLKDLVKTDPDTFEGWQGLASLYIETKQTQKALDLAKRGLKQFPNDAYAWYTFATMYQELGKKPEAVAAYKKSIALDPDNGGSAAKAVAELTGEKIDPRYLESEALVVPLVVRGNTMYVDADVLGPGGKPYPVHLLVDTGADTTVLYSSFLKRHGIAIPKDAPMTEIRVVGGATHQVPVARVQLQLGDQVLDRVPAVIVDDPAGSRNSDGILGMNVMKRYAVTIDHDAKTLRLAH